MPLLHPLAGREGGKEGSVYPPGGAGIQILDDRVLTQLCALETRGKLPVFTFVDTPGAYPGIDAEERGQSEAIGRNIFEMAQLEVPIIATIIGTAMTPFTIALQTSARIGSSSIVLAMVPMTIAAMMME